MTAAKRSEDDLLVAGAAWRLAVVLRHNGYIQESIDVPLATAHASDPNWLSPYSTPQCTER